jgi:hypothetical protein
MMFYQLKNYKEAEILFARCLKTYQNQFGDKHPDTIRSMKNLGGCLDPIFVFSSLMQ